MKLFLGVSNTRFAFLVTGKECVVLDKSSNTGPYGYSTLVGKFNDNILNCLAKYNCKFEDYKSNTFDVIVVGAIVEQNLGVVLMGEQEKSVFKDLGLQSKPKWEYFKKQTYSRTLLTARYKLGSDKNFNNYVEYVILHK